MIHSERIHKYHNAHFVNVGSCDWGRKLIPDSSDGGSRQASTDCIVTIAMDSYMKLWKFDDVAGVLKLENSKEAMTIGFLSVALSPDASVAATSTYDSMLMLWDTTTGELKKKFDYQLLEIWTIAFLPNSNHIITGSNDGKVKKICLDTGAVVQTWNTGGTTYSNRVWPMLLQVLFVCCRGVCDNRGVQSRWQTHGVWQGVRLHTYV